MKKIVLINVVIVLSIVLAFMSFDTSWYYDYILWWMDKLPMIYGRFTPEFMVMESKIGYLIMSAGCSIFGTWCVKEHYI